MVREAVIFLDPNEFGEELTVDGLPMLGCWDEEIQPAPKFFGATMDVIGVNTVERLLFMLPPVGWPCPVPDQEIEVDGAIWTVRDARPESGILKLTVYRNES